MLQWFMDNFIRAPLNRNEFKDSPENRLFPVINENGEYALNFERRLVDRVPKLELKPSRLPTRDRNNNVRLLSFHPSIKREKPEEPPVKQEILEMQPTEFDHPDFHIPFHYASNPNPRLGEDTSNIHRGWYNRINTKLNSMEIKKDKHD